MNSIDVKYKKVIDLAKEIGSYQKSKFRNLSLQVMTKSSSVDLVTEVDMYCDQLIVNKLKEWFPEDHILSEEQGLQMKNGAKYTWIIDPLDGTTNFSVGHPIFAVSIARWQDETPEFGVVYVPMVDELFVAERNKGAFHNDKPMVCSQAVSLSTCVLGTGFPYDRATARNNNSENVQRMISKVKGIRRLGAAAYDLCLVAGGILDAYWELRLGKWDLGAGMLMVLESGGSFHSVETGGKYNVICGAPEICERIAQEVDMEN
ncbi:inositol monophosphatase family protein [Fusibacter tunisiensis]|uniref:Inositol-1-monophosphatase n=1 Tax=Fusibacter tunisiensis TaxID=1008308 RepID=A0ABS2MRN8_9FIRM|nr:myo-inositol-1(or 4)-monophosphatase [Fusibacter tunisiensis]